VCKALHKWTKEIRACKILAKSRLSEPKEVALFQRELCAQAYIQHENVVKLHDFFSDDLNHYLILDYCPGGELFQHIVSAERLSEQHAAVMFQQVVSAVAYCHSFGIAHRDLKPENILVTCYPRVKVSDFGLCGAVCPARLMQTFCGSPCYCAPECLMHIEYDGRLGDLWSLGILLYAMVTGMHPWTVTNPTVMIRQIRKARLEVPRFVSDDCRDLILGLIQVIPASRMRIEQIIAHPWLKGIGSAGLPRIPRMSFCDITKEFAKKGETSRDGIVSPFCSAVRQQMPLFELPIAATRHVSYAQLMKRPLARMVTLKMT
jgi:serine/threonine protein kinase